MPMVFADLFEMRVEWRSVLNRFARKLMMFRSLTWFELCLLPNNSASTCLYLTSVLYEYKGTVSLDGR